MSIKRFESSFYLQIYIQHNKAIFSTVLAVILRVFMKSELYEWRARCIWTIYFKQLQIVEFLSIEDLQ